MRTRSLRLPAAALALALPLLGAACSDDSSDASTDDVVEAPSETTARGSGGGEMSSGTTMPGSMAMGDDIVDTAVAAGSFSTLVTAVQAADLEDTLRSDGPFTVFAPTDAAFQALPAGTLDALLADPQGALAPILTYHVVSGEVMAADVAGLDGQAVTTVNGATFTVNVDGGSVSLTDGAGNRVNVVQTDVEASNGVIHVIDGVLLPG